MSNSKNTLKSVAQELAELDRKRVELERKLKVEKLEKKIDVIEAGIVKNESVLESILALPKDELQEVMDQIFNEESFKSAMQNAMPDIMLLREKKEKRKKKKAEQNSVTEVVSEQSQQRNFVSENRVHPVQNGFAQQGNL